MPLDPADTRPLSVQIAADLRRAIQMGEYQAGELLPPIEVLAERYGDAGSAVRMAFQLLRGTGVVVRRGNDFYVAAGAQPGLEEILEQLNTLFTLVDKLTKRLLALEELVRRMGPDR